MRKITSEESKQIKAIQDVNSKKDVIQSIAVDAWWEKKKGLIECYTGFGKGHLISKIIQKINATYPNYTITILSPTNKLEESFDDKIEEFELRNTTSTTIQSYVKKLKDGTAKTDVLIVDEGHWVSNDKSVFFSEILPSTEWTYFLACSATFERNHIDYFKKQGIEKVFSFSMEDGFMYGLVPDYTTYCIGVNLLDEEKEEYIKLQRKYDNHVKFFAQYDIRNPIGAIFSVIQKKGKVVYYDGVRATSEQHAKRISEKLNVPVGSIIGVGLQWMNVCSARMRMLNSAQNLVKATMYILKNIVKDQIIVFCPSIQSAKEIEKRLPNSVGYHSGYTEKKRETNLKKFEDGEVQYLLTVKALDQGYDLPTLRLGLQFSYSSKKLQFTQRNGRVTRYDPNDPHKQCFFICLYIDDFFIDGELIESQQKKWLQNSLQGRNFVEWIKLGQLKI